MAEIAGYNMPDELYYHGEHAWVKKESDEVVVVGMNEFYLKLAGDTTYIDLPFEGDEVTQGETCGKIQSSKWVAKLVAPLTGEVVEVNSELEDDPTLMNKDPYDKGWVFKVKPSKLSEEVAGLLHGDAVKPWLEKEKEKADKESS
ncbi:glycine cleavage system protein GcvH [candidate division TA06 bacterium]|uniref:Glycine cleavage system H protein n=1 Tax=candidate division TA06 bacterium TaxID=2250710 RepID=A0A523XJY6_UNCT6|nr:MAG: glycine cleavage system protein GcvH [candidate division TA06 bacterium]TET79611.1 MAG: glycine cleavage system protein GcvH [candidate division TA06 bacterium]